MTSVETLSGQTLGQYQIYELLGVGGMSAVYHGLHSELGRHVAIKVLSPILALEPGYAQRFILEARTVASLEHPHIVPIYDYGTIDRTSFLVMRLLTGGTLAQRLDEHFLSDHPLPSLGEIAFFLNQMASALDYAHKQGVIHRDLKTGNVMFDHFGNAYLVDFGIAKILSSSSTLTHEGHIMGTSAYIAPEQWRSEVLTPAVDQYAMGVVVYFMLTGELPFDGPTSHELMYKHVNEQPIPIQDLRPNIPQAVNQVVLKALEKNPGDRYPSMSNFAVAFSESVTGYEGKGEGFFTFSLAPQTLFMTPISTTDIDSPLPVPTPQALPKYDSPVFIPPPPPAQGWHIMSDPGVAPSQPIPKRAKSVHNSSSFVASAMIGAGIGLVILLLLAALVVFVLTALANGRRADASAETMDVAVQNVTLTSPTSTIWPTEVEETTLFIATNVTTPSVSNNTRISVDNVAQINEYQNWRVDNGSPVRTVAFSPDQQLIAAGSGDGLIRLWSVENERQLATFSGQTQVIYKVVFSPDGRLLASGAGDGFVKLWDTQAATTILTIPAHIGQVRDLAFSSDGQWLVSCGTDGFVRIWNVQDGASLLTLSGHSSGVLCVDIARDSKMLVSGDQGGEIILWDVASGTQIANLQGHTGEIHAVKFSPDGTRIASASNDNTIRFWDVRSATTISTLDGSGQDMYSVAFSPDGSILASGSRDNTVRLWNIATERLLGTLTGHTGWVFSVMFSADGTALVSGGGDGTVRLWATNSIS